MPIQQLLGCDYNFVWCILAMLNTMLKLFASWRRVKKGRSDLACSGRGGRGLWCFWWLVLECLLVWFVGIYECPLRTSKLNRIVTIMKQ